MQTFTGWEYLLIDAANNFGLDKKLFGERIQWATENLSKLEEFTEAADKPPLYAKAVMAIRKAQKGIPSGHLVGFDACCSGIQVMSAMTGCVVGATNTGLVDPNVRADAYTICTKHMEDELGGSVNVSRSDAKDGLMTSFYGSKAKPKEIFGEDTPELSAFYRAAHKTAPGAWEVLQDLLASWQSGALVHSWKLPDGYDARVKVMVRKEARIEVDALDHSTFTYEFYENEGTEKGLSNVANVVHSVDAYVLRSIIRRCNYNEAMVVYALGCLEHEQQIRLGASLAVEPEGKVAYYVDQWRRSGMADVVILPYIGQKTARMLPNKLLDKLVEMARDMLKYKPFEVVTVHDEFKCHPNNMNHLRQQYINIFSDLADSDVLSGILSQIHGKSGVFPKLSTNLSQLIKGSNYALS